MKLILLNSVVNFCAYAILLMCSIIYSVLFKSFMTLLMPIRTILAVTLHLSKTQGG